MTETALDTCVDVSRALVQSNQPYNVAAIQAVDAAASELSRLRADSRELAATQERLEESRGLVRDMTTALENRNRELAAMKAGGVWLPRLDVNVLETQPGTYVLFSFGKPSHLVTVPVGKILGLLGHETAYGPLPSEGRDDGEA